MKNSIFFISFFILSFAANAQKVTDSDFYKSFYKHLSFRSYSSYKDKVSFNSILLTVDANGTIINWEPSTTVDSTLRRDIARAFGRISKEHLRIGDYKNSKMILPLIILNGPLRPIDDRMWQYSTGDTGSKSNPILLPPIVVFLGFNKEIIN